MEKNHRSGATTMRDKQVMIEFTDQSHQINAKKTKTRAELEDIEAKKIRSQYVRIKQAEKRERELSNSPEKTINR